MALQSSSITENAHVESVAETSLFERFPGLYAFFRERLFRDDTDRIIASLQLGKSSASGATLIELGCGPGFYARRLSERFPALTAIGIDRSTSQLRLAVKRASARPLPNCRFEWGDAQAVAHASDSIDAVVASRLITVLPDPERTIGEIHRVLRPGGRCFIAEPRPHPLARLPLQAMWAVAGVATLVQRRDVCFREPVSPSLLAPDEFARLIATRPWREALVWTDGRYQYAVCVKA